MQINAQVGYQREEITSKGATLTNVYIIYIDLVLVYENLEACFI